MALESSWVRYHMKVYLINLDKDKERLAAADAQLKRIGVAYERASAVYAKELPREELDVAVNKFRWWCAVGRPVRVGEIGCAMSHYMIYRKMTEPVCVLEDDVILDDRFSEVLDFVERKIDRARSQVILLSNHTRHIPNIPNLPNLQTSHSDMFTEGYVLTPLAAQALLKANWPMQVPCDHWGRWVGRGIIELYHAFPTVCRQDQSQYTSGTVDKGCFRVTGLGPIAWCFHKFKRLIGKSLDSMLSL